MILTEKEPLFDAAEILRFGKDLFYHNNFTSNLSGLDWLQRHFPNHRVHQINLPGDLIPTHIDACLTPIKPGLMIINPNRKLSSEQKEIFDKSILLELGKLGLIAPTIPAKYEGAELNHVCYGLIAYEIEKVDSGYRSAMSVQSSLVIHPIFEFGSDEQKKIYIPELIKGKLIGCFGLTEPDHGPDPSSMKKVPSVHSRQVDDNHRQRVSHPCESAL